MLRVKRRMNRRKGFQRLLEVTMIVWMVGTLWFLYYLVNTKTALKKNEHRSLNETNYCDKNVYFNDSFVSNLEKLKRNNFTQSLPWLRALDLNKSHKSSEKWFPVLTTAVSRNFFILSQGLVKSVVDTLLPVYPSLKFIYYDLDLDKGQVNLIRQHCKCEIRQLPLHQLPPHVKDFRNYAFKPIIISEIYEEFGNVWWVDSSARFISRDLRLPLKYLKEKGMLFFTYDVSSNIAKHTDRRMFTYFNEDPCLFANFCEIEASNIAFQKNHVTRVVLRQWLSCALDQNCIAPKDAIRRCEITTNMKQIQIGQCHRFDQSAISIILRRLYHKQNDYPLVEKPFNFLEIRRREKIPFFGFSD